MNGLSKVFRCRVEVTRLPRMQQRDVVVQHGIARFGLEALFNADDLLAHDSCARRAHQTSADRRIACDDLQPQFGHFIGRVLTVGHAARRTMRVVPVPRRSCRR